MALMMTRTPIVSLVVIVAALVVSLHIGHADSPRLVPRAARSEWNAANITSACGTVLANAAAKECKPSVAADAANGFAFCANPLSGTWVPKTAVDYKLLEDLGQLTAGKACPTLARAAAPTGTNSGVSTASGASWQDTFLLGLVAFLEERAKAEALASLASHIQHDLCKGDYSFLMPSTCALLGGTDVYADPLSWSALRAAFEVDLKQLPDIVIRKLFTGDTAEPFLTLAEAIPLIERGSPPVEIIIGIRDRYEDAKNDCTNKPYSCSLYLLGAATEILSTPPGSPPKDIEKYLLVATRLLSAAAGWPSAPTQLAQPLRSLHLAITNLENAAQKAGSKADPATFKAYRQRLGDVLALVGEVSTLVPWTGGKNPIPIKTIEEVIQHLEAAVDDTRDRNYVAAFGELQASLKLLAFKIPPWFPKYGGFIAEVATAQKPEDVQKALEAAASPVGAWRRKRGSQHSAISVQAYVGAQGGFERLSADGAPTNYARQGGLFAPVGIEGSWGFAHDWSAGFLLSAIDLGALVDVRESGDKVQTSSQIGFRQVFSPGVYGVLGLGFTDGGLPIVLGAGISISPELRSFDDGTNKSVAADTFRFSIFAAIDIPIFLF